jgi:tetratricopeptide (TPR) repeat protein
VLALFAKPTAAFVLPVAILIEWTHEGRVRWKWYALMALAFAAYAAVEFAAHQRSGAAEAVLYRTPFVLVRTVATHALRYLVMAATSHGVSAFHDPDPAYSVLDPRWLCALVALGLLGWRLAAAVRGRKRELPYWAWALISFGPVSQIFPFLYPVADRYLYFILPGLIGGALLAAGDALDRLPAALEGRPGLLGAGSLGPEGLRRMASRAGVVLGIAAALLFAVRSHDRAGIWRSPARIVADSAAHYPNGTSAHLQRAKRASRVGDVDGAVAGVRAAMDRGFNRFEQLWTDPVYAPVRDHPRFRALIREIAADWIEMIGRHENPTQLELAMIANAHYVRGEKAEAVEMFRRALARGGPNDAKIRAEIDALLIEPD